MQEKVACALVQCVLNEDLNFVSDLSLQLCVIGCNRERMKIG
jgi:hypothetical protein